MYQSNSTDDSEHAQEVVPSGSSFRSLAVSALNLTCGLYVISVMIVAPYYNWEYVREHSFADWLVWGEVAPTAKALVWPYFALHRSIQSQNSVEVGQPLSQRQINEMQTMSAMRALAAAQQANYIINSQPPDSPMTQEQIQKVIDYANQSLRSADATDEEALNKLYPEFGTRFKGDLCGGLRLLISGLKAKSTEDLERSGELDRAWRDWYNANRKQIGDAFNKAVE